MSRFVRPEVRRVHISAGDWLDLKKRLTAGETRNIYKRMMVLSEGRHVPHLDPVQVGLSKIIEYLVDWSLKDDSGTVVPVRDQPDTAVASAINALDPDDFQEILAAVENHENEMTAERDAEKNKTDGADKSSATSPSHDSYAVPTTK